MFRLISLLGLLGITAAIVWAVRTGLVQVAGAKQALLQQSLDLTNNLRRWRSLSTTALLGTLMRLFYLSVLGSVVVLALTGFLPVVLFGGAVSNVALMLHLVLAPIFAVGFTGLVLFWAQRHRFNKSDGERLRHVIRKEKPPAPQTHPTLWQKICFWSSLVLALPVIASTILMMYPLYGTPGQQWLLHLHGYAGLLLLAVAVLHTYLVLVKKHD